MLSNRPYLPSTLLCNIFCCQSGEIDDESSWATNTFLDRISNIEIVLSFDKFVELRQLESNQNHDIVVGYLSSCRYSSFLTGGNFFGVCVLTIHNLLPVVVENGTPF